MKKLILILFAFLVYSMSIQAQRSSDVEGSKDFSLVSRFSGSVIEWYSVSNFDKYYVLSLKDNKLNPYEIAGKITRIQYSAGTEHSIFEIANSYVNTFKNSGFKVLVNLDERNSPSNLNEELYYDEFNGLNKLPRAALSPSHQGKWAYIVAKKQRAQSNVYIVIYVTNSDFPLITFDAIEEQNMAPNLVTIKSLEENLANVGHLTLAGVFFETGNAVIKPESKAAMDNIAAFLKAHGDKKYYIVGHTDNSGDFEANMKLSKERALSVQNSLIKNYGLDANQLGAYGVGALCPLSTNSSNDGKALNRRVEIVEQ